MERQMTQLDKESYLKKMKNKIINQEVIHLIEEDLDKGLTASEIDDYATRGLNLQQMKAVSAMYHKKFPIGVIATIGGLNVDAEKMLVATQLYENGVAIEDIETALGGTKTAHDMRIAFSNVLSKVQEGLAITEDAVKEAEKEDSKKEERPAYVAELLEQLKSVVQKINYQDERYDAFNEKLKEFETAKRDEVVEKNLTSLNEKLEKENRELSEQLAGKQDEIAKGLQTVSKLRSEIDKIREEKNKMEEKVNRLTEENEQIAREQKAKGQETESEENVSQAEKRVDASYKESVQNEERLTEQRMQDKSQILPPVKEGAIPVYYTLTMVNGNKVISNSDIEIMSRKPSVFESIMSKFAFKKKSHKNLIQLVINKELSAEQVNEIRGGMEKGLDEEQLEIIINKNLSPEKIRSIVGFAALQNSLKAERGGC